MQRRSFIAGLVCAGGVTFLAPPLLARRFRAVAADITSNPFRNGVRAGDPLPGSMILWTRLCPDPTALNYGMDTVDVPVIWEVATDENFFSSLQTGTFVTQPEWGHSVHVSVSGLADDTEYFYRFKCFGYTSRVGRFRTLPAASSTPQEIRFVVAGCQHYEFGFFTAWRRIAQEPNIRAVIFNGDWIYEGPSHAIGVNGRCRSYPNDGTLLPSCGTSLAEFRRRYAVVGLDNDLLVAGQSTVLIPRMDDHEAVNNYTSDPATHLQKVAGFQAWYENMPVRRRGYVANSGVILSYDDYRFGNLVEIAALDSRQWKSPLPCGDLFDNCPAASLSTRTMLGTTQEAWLQQVIANSPTIYQVISQGVIFSRVDFSPSHNVPPPEFYMDGWDGSNAARERLLGYLAQKPNANPIVLSGDYHKGFASNVPSISTDPLSAPAAAEVLCPAISSGGDGGNLPYVPALLAANPHVKSMFDQRGYILATATPASLRLDFKTLPYVSTAGAQASIRETYFVTPGIKGFTP